MSDDNQQYETTHVEGYERNLERVTKTFTCEMCGVEFDKTRLKVGTRPRFCDDCKRQKNTEKVRRWREQQKQKGEQSN